MVARPRKSPIDPGAALVSKKVPWPSSSKLASVQIIAVGSKSPIGTEALAANPARENPTRQEMQWPLKTNGIVA